MLLDDKEYVRSGDLLTVQKPAGDFVYDPTSTRTLVLLSSGIGVTPLLSMLYKFVDHLNESNNVAYWIHSATDGSHHPFQEEIQQLSKLAKHRLKLHITYTKHRPKDSGYDSTTRVDAKLVSSIVPKVQNADVFMCGTAGFIADLTHGLENEIGVPAGQIHHEDFSS